MKEYQNILDNITDNIFVIDIDINKLIFLNTSARKLLKYTNTHIHSMELKDFLIPFNNENIINLESLKEYKNSNNNLIFRAFIQTHDLTKTPVEIRFSYIENKGKQFAIVICFDISKQIILELQESANKEIIDDYIPISQTDLNGNITYVNKAFCNLTGYDKTQLLGKTHSILKHKDTSISKHKELWENITNNIPWQGVLKNKLNNNKTIWTEIKIKPMYDYLGNKVGYISTREDISDKKELEYLSEHDLLTNIKNRRTFEKELKKQVELSLRYESNSFGLIMIDIDNFKSINDNYGHQIGDFILQTLTKNINTNLRHSDIFARWGGEEFIILCPYSNTDQMEQLAENLKLLIPSINFNPVKELTISMGITAYKKDDSEDTIQRRVDKALYKAKINGKNRYETL
jgi:diguanylate cyclase (GGDEF)-like protein/PAS domain S-box-containing protein